MQALGPIPRTKKGGRPPRSDRSRRPSPEPAAVAGPSPQSRPGARGGEAGPWRPWWPDPGAAAVGAPPPALLRETVCPGWGQEAEPRWALAGRIVGRVGQGGGPGACPPCPGVAALGKQPSLLTPQGDAHL